MESLAPETRQTLTDACVYEGSGLLLGSKISFKDLEHTREILGVCLFLSTAEGPVNNHNIIIVYRMRRASLLESYIVDQLQEY